MARVVILSFRDNDIAEAAIHQLLDMEDTRGTDAIATDQVMSLGVILAAGAKVEAVIARPTSGCRCKGNTKGQFQKTPRFGWFVHKTCKKPSIWVVRRFIGNMYVGYNNLLGEILEKRQPKENTGDDAATNVEGVG